MGKDKKLVKNQNKLPFNYQDVEIQFLEKEDEIEKKLYRNIPNIQNSKSPYFSISFYKSISRFV